MCWRRLKCGACCLGLLLAGPAAAQAIFTDVTEEALGKRFSWARAAIFGDYNNDDRPDIFLSTSINPLDVIAGKFPPTLLQNEGKGAFVEHTSLTQQVGELPWLGPGAVFVDYDNDGDLDLFAPAGGYVQVLAAANLLLRNDAGHFRDVALEAGLTEVRSTDAALWFDYDRDGDVDLYVGNVSCSLGRDPEVTNDFYRSNGDGTFTRLADALGLGLEVVNSANGFCFHQAGHGMSAGDFDNDGWPDLYLAMNEAPNRLFLNDGTGAYRDVTTGDIADPGKAGAIAVGDIDNDGDLEIFQAAGSSGGGQYRSLLLLNLGEGQFLDVTEAVGLGALGAFNLQGTGLADIDNDGDLDLLTNDPLFLFLNDGTGIFSDHTSQSGLEGGQLSYGLSFADYDQDGFLDVLLGAVGPHPGSVGVFHNQGNANHWLQVELVGAASNRSGIGARLIATAGKLQQLREIFGGRGLNQDDLVAHFGLGDRVRIDRLEVRWPSGQVDVLTDIPADQKIRVFEGRTSYHPIVPARGGVAPDTLVIGRPATLTLAVQPALFEPNATITQVTADLSPFGGPDSVPLAPTSDGTWTMETLPLSVTGANGVRSLHLMIDQQTSLGLHWTQLSRSVGVLPAADLVVFGDALAQGWQVKTPNKVEFDFEARTVVFSGKAALALNPSSFFWTVQCLPAEPVRHFGYTALRFAFHPGEVIPPRDSKLSININKEQIDLLGPGQALVDLEAKDWQVVEVPLDFLEADEPITLLTFQGNLKGTFYLDDIRLVAVSPPPLTVVEEERTASLPQAFSLSQNFPNPFNSDTVIRFALPEGGEVVLAVYNLAGQQVAKLAEGTREAGSYTLRWDGRDERGKELASGVYLYRLRAGAQVETQKLVLLR